MQEWLTQYKQDRVSERLGVEIFLICLGPKKQEMIANMILEVLGPKRIICCGGAVDFLVGKERRAPRWARQCGLEWVFRIAQNPKRIPRLKNTILGLFYYVLAVKS